MPSRVGFCGCIANAQVLLAQTGLPYLYQELKERQSESSKFVRILLKRKVCFILEKVAAREGREKCVCEREKRAEGLAFSR